MRYKIYYGIKNLIRWFPIIWRDRDWDWDYLVIMLQHKLIGIEKQLELGRHIYWKKDWKRVHYAKLLCKRLVDQDYFENSTRLHNKKWGETKFNWDDVPGEPYVSLRIEHENAITNEEKEQERIERGRCFKSEEYMIKQDLSELTTTLNKYLRSWWD